MDLGWGPTVNVSRVSVCLRPWTDSMVNVIGFIGKLPTKRDDERVESDNQSIGHDVLIGARKAARETETGFDRDRSIRP